MAKIGILRAVRRFCLECQGESSQAVRECADADCPLHLWRLPQDITEANSVEASAPRAPQSQETIATDAHKAALAMERLRMRRAALRTVRKQCMACAGDRKDVRSCAARDCSLWSFRFGVLPEKYKAVRARFFAPKKLSLF